MSNIIHQALDVKARYARASAREVLDLAMEGYQGDGRDVQPESPASEFGQLVAEAFDSGMKPEDWKGLMTHCDDQAVIDVLTGIWRGEVWEKFLSAYSIGGRVPAAQLSAASKRWARFA